MENLFFLIFPPEKLNRGEEREDNERGTIMYSEGPAEMERLQSISNEEHRRNQ